MFLPCLVLVWAIRQLVGDSNLSCCQCHRKVAQKQEGRVDVNINLNMIFAPVQMKTWAYASTFCCCKRCSKMILINRIIASAVKFSMHSYFHSCETHFFASFASGLCNGLTTLILFGVFFCLLSFLTSTPPVTDVSKRHLQGLQKRWVCRALRLRKVLSVFVPVFIGNLTHSSRYLLAVSHDLKSGKENVDFLQLGILHPGNSFEVGSVHDRTLVVGWGKH